MLNVKDRQTFKNLMKQQQFDLNQEQCDAKHGQQ